MEGGLAPHVLPSPQLCVNPTTKQIEPFRYENMEITTKSSSLYIPNNQASNYLKVFQIKSLTTTQAS